MLANLANAFNAMVRALEIEGEPLTRVQKMAIFDQLALAANQTMGKEFNYATFEDACRMNEPV